MAGKKDKKQKKKGKSLSHIGTALFPRAIFTAVPRSPEPPQPARSPTPTQGRPASALSSAIMDATIIGRAVASPSPNSTLRTTGNLYLTSTLPQMPGREEGEADTQPFGESGSMARSSMYDYDDSDEEEEDEDDDEDLDYMGGSKRQQQMEYHDDPGYAKVEDIQEMLADHQKRGTISNRGRLNTPISSQGEESPMPTNRTGANTNRSELDTPGRISGELPSTSQAEIHGQDYPSDRDEGLPYRGRDDVDGRGSSEKKKKKKKTKEKKKKSNRQEDLDEDLYAQPIKKSPLLDRRSPTPSNDSDLTGVTNPTADDFSDLISPPPPWKRKTQSPDVGNPDLLSGRSSKKKSSKSKSKRLIEEPVIQKATTNNQQYASGPSMNDGDMYSHLNHSQTLDQSLTPHHEEDYLRRATGRLEAELRLVERERDGLLGSLDQRTQQLVEEKARSQGLQQQMVHSSRAQRTDLNKSLGHLADLEAQVSELNSTCQQQREEKRSLQEVNKRLRAENRALQETADTGQEDDGVYLSQLKSQAEVVIQENEELKNVVHKLNIHLSRYQAKYAPPSKGDPPGLPSRGTAPRWLADTTYLSPLVKAYEAQLMEKEEEVRGNLEDVEELRRSAELVVRENQRLHRRLEETGGGAGPGMGGRTSDSWMGEMEEQARLVLEENQVVMEQMDLQQKKLQDQHRKHTQESIRLTKHLTMLEAEKNASESDLSELQIRYGALKDQHERTIRERESQMPVQEHLDAIAEYKRNIQDLKRKTEADTENTLSRLTAVEAEKTSVAMRIADYQAENSQLKGEIHALHKAQKQLQHKLTMLEKELTHSRSRENAANQHLNRVLEIAEQTAAERDSFKKMAHAQAQEKERAVNKMMAGNVALGRMEEKLKTYKHRAERKVDDVLGRMKDQDEMHTSRLGQYEREMRHLSHLVREKQDALDHVAADKQKVEDQLEVVWQSATEDSKRLKAKLARSLKSSLSADSNLPPFGSDSDNRGFMSSESD